MAAEKVILVSPEDEVLGTMDKQQAHEEGVLHRAFSVFVFNRWGDLILQRRAVHKYHSAGLWTNTCCSHPRPGEDTEAAAHRRLQEEMGFDCPLEFAFTFEYRAQVGDLIEHELDHVYVGQYDGEPVLDPEEVDAWEAVSPEVVSAALRESPEDYTAWFKIVWARVLEWQEGRGT